MARWLLLGADVGNEATVRTANNVIRLDPIRIRARAREEVTSPVDHSEPADPGIARWTSDPWSRAPTLDAVAGGLSVLRAGHRGEAVKELQRFLNQHHPGQVPLEVDGFLGAETLGRLKSFQAAAGLSPDGIVGKQTLASMTELTARDILLDPRFVRLPAAVQRQAVRRLEAVAHDAEGHRQLTFLLLSDAYAALSPQEQAGTLSLERIEHMRLALGA